MCGKSIIYYQVSCHFTWIALLFGQKVVHRTTLIKYFKLNQQLMICQLPESAWPKRAESDAFDAQKTVHPCTVFCAIVSTSAQQFFYTIFFTILITNPYSDRFDIWGCFSSVILLNLLNTTNHLEKLEIYHQWG